MESPSADLEYSPPSFTAAGAEPESTISSVSQPDRLPLPPVPSMPTGPSSSSANALLEVHMDPKEWLSPLPLEGGASEPHGLLRLAFQDVWKPTTSIAGLREWRYALRASCWN